MHRRTILIVILGAASAATLGSACGGLSAGGAGDTLAPLVPASTGPPVTEVRGTLPGGQPVVNTQGPTTTTLPRGEDPITLDPDEGNALSVAARFLAAAATGDRAAASDLEVAGREPTTFDWANAAFDQYTAVAGAQAWGEPRCEEPTGSTVRCSWLQIDVAPHLLLTLDSDRWRVSNPLFNVAGDPQQVGDGCIVGSQNVNFRGGPGTNWPRFDQIRAGTCGVKVFDSVHTDPSNGDRWRLVEADDQRGWVIERVLRIG